jgi:Ca2+-transporting ATPase
MSRWVRSWNGEPTRIPTAEIVIDDLVIAQEGNTINADGEIYTAMIFLLMNPYWPAEPYAVFKSEKRKSFF